MLFEDKYCPYSLSLYDLWISQNKTGNMPIDDDRLVGATGDLISPRFRCGGANTVSRRITDTSFVEARQNLPCLVSLISFLYSPFPS